MARSINEEMSLSRDSELSEQRGLELDLRTHQARCKAAGAEFTREGRARHLPVARGDRAREKPQLGFTVVWRTPRRSSIYEPPVG